MSTHKNVNVAAIVAIFLAVVLTVFCIGGASTGLIVTAHAMGYENRLFDTDRVHTVDIVMDDWDSFIATCKSEEYSPCTVVIDGEKYANIGIRGKGNTSLSNVESMDSDRYSFKLEFDQYQTGNTYHGLDKLCLNNIIQDNTYMKDYLAYQMMTAFGVDTPLCSFVYITVNGEDWGLYLAVEGVEDSFLQRNYGSDYGELYKPDSMSFGGGRGNGKDFNMDDFDFDEDFMKEQFSAADSQGNSDSAENETVTLPDGMEMPSFGDGQMPQMPGGMNMPQQDGMEQNKTGDESAGSETISGEKPDMPDMTEQFNFTPGDMPDMGGNIGGGGFGMGSSDVKLQYIDDEPDSYSNIFNNAKTEVTDKDQSRLIDSLESLSKYENLSEVLDTEEVLRYFVVHNYLVNGDSYTGSMIHNYYLYEENGQLSMIPWDYNLAFGTFQGNNASSSVNDPIDEVLDDRPMQAWIFSDDTYSRQYHTLYQEFLQTVDIQSIIDEAYEMIAPYVEKDPTAFCTYEEFETGVAALKQFCLLRSESVEGQLNGSIPSTDAEQSADGSALVDTGELNIADMGTMSMGGGDHGEKMGERQSGSEPSADVESSATVQAEGNDSIPQMPAEGENGKPQMPNSGSFAPSQMLGGSMPNGNMPAKNK